jgi:hypothetical protein
MTNYDVKYINLKGVEKTAEILASDSSNAKLIFEREFFMMFRNIVSVTKFNIPLRCAAVTYANGEIITTSLSSGLTDQQIKDYFAIGKKFNIGNVTDNVQAVTNVEIIR